MKKILFFVLIILLFLSSQVIGQTDRISEVPRISPDLAYLEYQSEKVIFVDAMNEKTFAGQHILGAINLPAGSPADLERVKNTNPPIPKGMEIIVYCS